MVAIQNEVPRRGRGRPQVRSDDETRALIVEAGRQEFQANGYEATSIAAVAERAGVSTKTLYRLIPTKAELLACVVSDRIGQFVIEIDLSTLDSMDAAAALERMLIVFGTLTLDPEVVGMTRLVIGECRAFPEIGAAFYKKAIQRSSKVMEDVLRRLCARGLIAIDDPGEAVGMLRGMMVMEPQRAAMLAQHNPPTAGEIKERAKRCTRIFLNGCAVGAGMRASGSQSARPTASATISGGNLDRRS
jgi:AcrR family transcriptional regulator